MTNSGKYIKKFNMIDFFLLLLIIAAVAFLVYIFVSPYTGSIDLAPKKNIEYKIRVDNVREEFRDILQRSQGKTVTSTSTLKEIGKVKDVMDEESVYPGLYTVTITVTAKANAEDGLYKVGDVVINSGTQIGFRVPEYTSEEGYCILVVGEGAENNGSK